MAGAYRAPQTEYAIRLYLSGLSVKESALKAGVHEATLYRALKPKNKKKLDKRSHNAKMGT